MTRARDSLSRAEVARRAGISASFISAVENGKANPNVTQMGQLAEGLGLAGASDLLAQAEDAAQRMAAST